MIRTLIYCFVVFVIRDDYEIIVLLLLNADIQRLKGLLKPSPLWGPALDPHRAIYRASVQGLVSEDAKEAILELTTRNKQELPAPDDEEVTPRVILSSSCE